MATVRMGSVLPEDDRVWIEPIEILDEPREGMEVTDEQFESIPAEAGVWEIVDGKLAEKKVANLSQIVAFRIGVRVENFQGGSRIGEATTEAWLRIDPDRPRQRRKPDFAFVSYRRLNGSPLDPDILVPPELVVESISPFDTVARVNAKVREYFRCGVDEVWLAQPDLHAIDVYRSLDDPRRWTAEQTLEVKSGVLAGLSFRVGDVFPANPPPTGSGQRP